MLKTLTSAQFARFLVPLLVICGYALTPLVLHWAGVENSYFVKLAGLSCIGALSMVAGGLLPLPLHRLPKVRINPEPFLAAMLVLFAAFVVVAWVTSEQIPLVASLRGADAETIAVLREQFLKAREGWQASFVYINAVFAGFLIPYSLAMMFVNRYRFRWICFAAFLAYSVSFSEKAFFLRAVLPLFYLVVQRKTRSFVGPKTIVALMAALLMAVTAISRLGATDRTGGEFFSSSYIPASPMEYMVWRAGSVPIATAADALKVFDERLDNQPQRGATSTFLARLSGRQVVYFERMVFEAQWGQNTTGTGSSNSVYITEAYVNYGIPGIVLFSVLIGAILRFFGKTRDLAFQSLWMIFALNIYTAGLIGTLLSNGLIVVLVLALFVRFNPMESREALPGSRRQLITQ